MKKVEIGNKIKEKRLGLNLTMDEVSLKVGTTRSTLWSVENGNGNYSTDTLRDNMGLYLKLWKFNAFLNSIFDIEKDKSSLDLVKHHFEK